MLAPGMFLHVSTSISFERRCSVKTIIKKQLEILGIERPGPTMPAPLEVYTPGGARTGHAAGNQRFISNYRTLKNKQYNMLEVLL